MSIPPLSRQNSSENLNLINQTTKEQSLEENEKQTTDPWKAAQANVTISVTPKLRNQTKPGHLRIISGGTNISEPHTAPVAKVVSNTASEVADSNSYPIASTSANSSGNGSSLNAGLVSPKVKASEKGVVHASDLPLGLSAILDI